MSKVENPRNVEYPKIVSRAEWLNARKELLAKEKEFTRRRDALNAERRRLPMVRRNCGECVQNAYVTSPLDEGGNYDANE